MSLKAISISKSVFAGKWFSRRNTVKHVNFVACNIKKIWRLISGILQNSIQGHCKTDMLSISASVVKDRIAFLDHVIFFYQNQYALLAFKQQYACLVLQPIAFNMDVLNLFSTKSKEEWNSLGGQELQQSHFYCVCSLSKQKSYSASAL